MSRLAHASRPLTLEALEDRFLLAACHVVRLADLNAGHDLGTGQARGDLRYCINFANNNSGPDSIDVAVTGTINLTSALPALTSEVTIDGPGPNLLTVRRDTGGNYPVFHVGAEATVGISGLTITNGYNPGLGGGGIRNFGILTIDNSVIANNTAGLGGGGIAQSGPSLTISNSTIEGNSVTDGDGAGIENYATLVVTNCTISGNTASTFGGGIANRSQLFLSNSTVSGNSASAGPGGGIFHGGNRLAMTNSTIAGNTATGNGGGVYTEGRTTSRNTIFAGNSAALGPDVFGNLGSLGHNLIGNTSGASGFAMTDWLNFDPMLGRLQDNGGLTETMALLSGSPAIDAGDNIGAPQWDQRGPGFPRIVNGTVDIGAFEVQAMGAPPVSPRLVPVNLVLITADLFD